MGGPEDRQDLHATSKRAVVEQVVAHQRAPRVSALKRWAYKGGSKGLYMALAELLKKVPNKAIQADGFAAADL